MTQFTHEELRKYDGTKGEPIYVAIKGKVYDVSGKEDMYGPQGKYHVFAGKDASKALAKSSLEEADCIPDISGLNDEEVKVLNNWVEFFEKRYTSPGTVA
ncbi:cytochrome b5-like heme/steroid binding domain-containing protein [Mortierella sp. GBAus27b]|nr:hypothetical protein BGX31_002813 [Mortierella sp. GBA43]KAI8345612.1 cytochrome b5-like heme/steroid binding domain-containing protein [Mortierella sp. GBAus27b]